MPLRCVAPLNDEQWKQVTNTLFSNEPEFVELRKKQRKVVKNAIKMASKLKVIRN